jgi:hypothetical protein
MTKHPTWPWVVGMAALVGTTAARAEDVFVPACPADVPGCMFGADLQEALDLAEEGGTVWVTADLEPYVFPEEEDEGGPDTGSPPDDSANADLAVSTTSRAVTLAGWLGEPYALTPVRMDGATLTILDAQLPCPAEHNDNTAPGVSVVEGALHAERVEALLCAAPDYVVDVEGNLTMRDATFTLFGSASVMVTQYRSVELSRIDILAGQRGISLLPHPDGGNVTRVDHTTVTGASFIGFAIGVRDDDLVIISQSEFLNHRSLGVSPSIPMIISIESGASAQVTISDVVFSGNYINAVIAAGGFATVNGEEPPISPSGGTLTLQDVSVTQATLVASPFYIRNISSVAMDRVTIPCVVDSVGGIFAIENVPEIRISNSVLSAAQSNHISDAAGGLVDSFDEPSALHLRGVGDAEIHNTAFLGPDAIYVSDSTDRSAGSLRLVNVVSQSDTLVTSTAANVMVSVSHPWFLTSVEPPEPVVGTTQVIDGLAFGVPGFQLWSGDSCEDFDFHLLPTSPLRDAGDPDPAYNDPDGSRNDIGAYGGPGADLVDADLDGVFDDLDCDEAADTIYYGADEVPWDDIDQDCDGADLIDVDQDGFVALQANGDDCDDEAAGVHPGATDVPYDGIDQNCDGKSELDLDGDGAIGALAGGTDCDDTDPTIHPGAVEAWYDGVDQNCDGNDLDRDLDGHNVPFDVFGVADPRRRRLQRPRSTTSTRAKPRSGTTASTRTATATTSTRTATATTARSLARRDRLRRRGRLTLRPGA